MSDSNSTAFKYFGLNCPNGGEFYICEGDATEFIGCCTSNPCGANKGVCPSGNLRASSFNQDVYADLPQQNCSNSAGVTNWYTCAYTNPPFMGCCSESACNSGCARSNLVPAVLSSNENNKLDFLTPDGDSSQTSASPSGSATSTGDGRHVSRSAAGAGYGTRAHVQPWPESWVELGNDVWRQPEPEPEPEPAVKPAGHFKPMSKVTGRSCLVGGI
ncbi:hypothetical protein AUP68_04536 [Ilyonectria robusta]